MTSSRGETAMTVQITLCLDFGIYLFLIHVRQSLQAWEFWLGSQAEEVVSLYRGALLRISLGVHLRSGGPGPNT